jgi:hypothetical protein
LKGILTAKLIRQFVFFP